MQTLTAQQTAEKWQISLRTVQNLCKQGKIQDAIRVGTNWLIPMDAARPRDGRTKEAQKNAIVLVLPRKSPFLALTDMYNKPGMAAKISMSLRDNPKARRLFDAEIAYYRGQIDVVRSHASYFLESDDGFYMKMGAGMLMAFCANWRGDLTLWNDAKRYISRTRFADRSEGEMLSLAMTAADSAIYTYGKYPDWFERGAFQRLPEQSHPAAKIFYARYLFTTAYSLASRQIELEDIRGLALMRMLPYIFEPMISQASVDRTVIVEAQLRLWCAVAYQTTGERERASEHVEKALALLLPDKLYGILAEFWRFLSMPMEEILQRIDPEAARIVKQLYQEYAQGHVLLRSHLQSKKVFVRLTPREQEVARLIAFGFTNKKVAETLGIGESTVKTNVHNIMQKTGLRDRADFVFIL